MEKAVGEPSTFKFRCVMMTRIYASSKFLLPPTPTGKYNLSVQANDNPYAEKYKGTCHCLVTLSRSLTGNYCNFGVFQVCDSCEARTNAAFDGNEFCPLVFVVAHLQELYFSISIRQLLDLHCNLLTSVVRGPVSVGLAGCVHPHGPIHPPGRLNGVHSPVQSLFQCLADPLPKVHAPGHHVLYRHLSAATPIY